jgi:hypothetical protein
MTVLLVSIHQNSRIQGSEDQVAMRVQETSLDLSDVLHHMVEVFPITVHHPMEAAEVTSAIVMVVGTTEETSRYQNVQVTMLEIANSEWTKLETNLLKRVPSMTTSIGRSS